MGKNKKEGEIDKFMKKINNCGDPCKSNNLGWRRSYPLNTSRETWKPGASTLYLLFLVKKCNELVSKYIIQF